MGLHGVEASERIGLSNMNFLYEQLKKADRVISF
jgi:hypothetical protein